MNIWYEKINHWAHTKGDQPFLVDENSSFTFLELKETLDLLAAQYQSQGLRPQDRVLVILPRSAVSATILTSLLHNHLVGLFVDMKTNINEIQKIIQTVKPHAIISSRYEGAYTSSTALSITNTPFIKPQLFTISDANTDAELTPENLSWLLTTSGSTGAIKAVMLSAENLIERTKSEIHDFRLSEEMTLLNVLPFSHDLGLNQLLTVLFLGGTLQIKTRTVARLSSYFANTKISGITGTPLMWADFLKVHPASMSFSHLKFITISGGALDLNRQAQLAQIFPNAHVYKTYGQTETFRTFLSEDVTSDDLGQVIAGVSIELSADGELIHFGQTRMLGYLFDPALSNTRTIHSSIYGDGILTQDLMRITEDGKYIFSGRKDDVVKRFEQRFHLSEIEETLRKHPGVLDAVAITTPAPKSDWRQNLLGVYVLLKTDCSSSNDEILRFAHEQLSYYKVPDFIKIVEQFPQTHSHKVDRQWLKMDLAKENVAHG